MKLFRLQMKNEQKLPFESGKEDQMVREADFFTGLL